MFYAALTAVAVLLISLYVGQKSRPRPAVPPIAPVTPAATHPNAFLLRRLIEELDSLGFYAYAAPDKVERIKQEALDSWYLFDLDTGRTYLADAEDLAEGGIGDFLQEVSPFLARQGVQPPEVEDDLTVGGAYSVTVNGVRYSIYSQEDLEHGHFWDLAHERTAAILNILLEQSGSKERAYLLSGGNEAELVFLTRKMYEAMRDSRLLDQVPREVDPNLFDHDTD